MANEEESFTAEVKTFMITKADDSTEKHEEKHECSRVIVQPCNNQNENDGCRMYKIVMYHHAKEVNSNAASLTARVSGLAISMLD